MTTTDETMTEYIVDTSRRGLTRGLAELDSEGRALKNPDPVLWETYVTWSTEVLDDASPVFIATYCGVHDEGFGEQHLFAPVAYILQPAEGVSTLDIRTSTSHQTIADRVWVKARFDAVPLTDDQMESATDRAQELRRELTTEQAWFSEFSDGLNELAESHGWCSQYDDIVRAVGLPGREKDYWVDVEAECTVTDSSPSSRLDSLLEEHYGPNFETSKVVIIGKVTVRVYSITASDGDDAYSKVTRDDVVCALDGQFSGEVALDSWRCTDSGEED